MQSWYSYVGAVFIITDIICEIFLLYLCPPFSTAFYAISSLYMGLLYRLHIKILECDTINVFVCSCRARVVAFQSCSHV